MLSNYWTKWIFLFSFSSCTDVDSHGSRPCIFYHFLTSQLFLWEQALFWLQKPSFLSSTFFVRLQATMPKEFDVRKCVKCRRIDGRLVQCTTLDKQLNIDVCGRWYQAKCNLWQAKYRLITIESVTLPDTLPYPTHAPQKVPSIA